MEVDPSVLRIINAYGDQAAEVRRQVLDFVRRTWGSLDTFRDADIDRFVNAVVPVVSGGQLRTAQLTDGYLAAVEAATLGIPPHPLGVSADLVTDEAMRGVPAERVYQRAGTTVWTALSKGVEIADAANRGLNRAIDLASTDLQLAKTHTAKSVFARSPRVVGYRRELGGGNSCALCIVASTQRYHTENLMPIHPGCSCNVAPIYGHSDPGQVIDEGTLADVHAAVADRFGSADASGQGDGEIPAYKDVMVVHDHGEIGPILGVKGQAFTGPDDLAD